MYKPRVIPVLLLKDDVLVKSIEFKKHKYIGDPINAVRIFNDLKVDEIVFLDIEATKEGRLISLDFVKNVGEEANIPFSVGGGIKTLSDIEKIIKSGAERVIINSEAGKNFDFIKNACDTFGSSTIIVCIDVKKTLFKGEKVLQNSMNKYHKLSPIDYAKKMEELGVGEIIIQSVDNDGMMEGYDIDLIKRISTKLSIPVVALGGCGSTSNLIEAYDKGYANGLATGSLFVYQSSKRGVLINYIDKEKLRFNRII